MYPSECFHCGAAVEEFMQTNSGRIVYKCPDCGKKQFGNGAYVPTDVSLRDLEQAKAGEELKP